MEFPPLFPVRNVAVQPSIADIGGEIRAQFRASKLRGRLKVGQRVAVACGSRGIANYAEIVRAVIAELREAGAVPFLVAAMGSHGGATEAGQRELLASYGVSEEDLGVEIRAEMDAEIIGTNRFGEPVWWDANALRADGVIAIARIKPHTDFRGKYESGLVKMSVIGLGKREGAAQHHRWGIRGLREYLPASAEVVLENTRFLGGLGILENARDETAFLDFVDRDDLLEAEPLLLERAAKMMGRLPFAKVDLLVIGELGKNFSGAGIDPNVVGRFLVETAPEMEPAAQKVTRIVCLDISPESHGNAVGIGLADITTDRALAAIDPVPFRMNTLTAGCLWRSKLPLAFPNDREAVAAALATCWEPIATDRKICIIPNTLEVGTLWVSAPLAEELKGNADWQVGGEAADVPFDEAGNIIQELIFPHGLRAKRSKIPG